MFVVTRSENNPILEPDTKKPFESYATFNGNPIKVGQEIILAYRAISQPENFDGNNFLLSIICTAKSSDGFNFKSRKKFIMPEEEWERYGCEDPRVTKIEKNYYIFYTAISNFPFSASGIRVGLAISPDMENISEKHLITPFNAKAMTIFPEKINGKYTVLLTVNTDLPRSRIAIAQFDKMEDLWNQEIWTDWYKNVDKFVLDIPKRNDGEHVEIGSCPIKTSEGWLLVYCHIHNYWTDHKIFTVEAVLLDLDDPQKVIGKTRGALLTPEEHYEKYGAVPNTIFPSGALVFGENLLIYYGATDTTCAVASVRLVPLLASMKFPYARIGFNRISKLPVLKPRSGVKWEEKAIFNPAAVVIDGIIRILYRAMSTDNTSVFGYAESQDGVDIIYRPLGPVYQPHEFFEEKRIAGGNSGCEDPRIVEMGDKLFVSYTAYNGVNPPAIALTSISKSDFANHIWNWSHPTIISRDGVDDKDGCLHPEKINGKYFLYHRVNNIICGDYGSTIEFPERNNYQNIKILAPRPGMWDGNKVGLSCPPIKTEKGWLVLYHGVSHTSTYRIGAILLDLNDPTIVLSRTTDAIFEPKEDYELEGQVGKVVFPCGAIVKNGMIYIYYGGGDSVINVARMRLNDLLETLVSGIS